MANSIYEFSVTSAGGKPVSMEQYRGKVLLIVNVASQCGFTPQYAGLEALYKKFKDRGFVILGFPCNQFGGQEPGTDDQIKSFCEMNFGVSFPILAKIDVNGTKAEPLFDFLKTNKRGFLGSAPIKWNFTKFLIAKDGSVIARYGSVATPDSLEGAIEAALQ
jgi:glutathione peroxidase